jgi:hypothetical protein
VVGVTPPQQNLIKTIQITVYLYCRPHYTKHADSDNYRGWLRPCWSVHPSRGIRHGSEDSRRWTGHRAIGVASLAFLYRCLDNVHENIISGTRFASKCSLFIPGHFIMGWFASFWKRAQPIAQSDFRLWS